MAKTKKVVVNAKTGKETIEEYEFVPEAPIPEDLSSTVDLKEVKKLLIYAKSKGWI